MSWKWSLWKRTRSFKKIHMYDTSSVRERERHTDREQWQRERERKREEKKEEGKGEGGRGTRDIDCSKCTLVKDVLHCMTKNHEQLCNWYLTKIQLKNLFINKGKRTLKYCLSLSCRRREIEMSTVWLWTKTDCGLKKFNLLTPI